MVWVFLLGIIALATFHPGFRKVALALCGVAAIAFVIIVIIAHTV